jgi:hypothetical protein
VVGAVVTAGAAVVADEDDDDEPQAAASSVTTPAPTTTSPTREARPRGEGDGEGAGRGRSDGTRVTLVSPSGRDHRRSGQVEPGTALSRATVASQVGKSTRAALASSTRLTGVVRGAATASA